MQEIPEQQKKHAGTTSTQEVSPWFCGRNCHARSISIIAIGSSPSLPGSRSPRCAGKSAAWLPTRRRPGQVFTPRRPHPERTSRNTALLSSSAFKQASLSAGTGKTPMACICWPGYACNPRGWRVVSPTGATAQRAKMAALLSCPMASAKSRVEEGGLWIALPSYSRSLPGIPVSGRPQWPGGNARLATRTLLCTQAVLISSTTAFKALAVAM